MTSPKTRLLVVEGDRLVLTTLGSELSRAGFDVLVATNADAGIRLAFDAKPALALIDAQLDGGSGLEVARFLARETKVPFVCLSDGRDEAVIRQAIALGALGFLVKPLDARQVAPAVQSALGRATEATRLEKGAAILADTLVQGRGRQALVAVGILVERHHLNCDQALTMLHENARVAGREVEDEALRVIEAAEQAAGEKAGV